MNALRNIFGNRALNYLRQNGQNALINLTQPAVDNGTPAANAIEKAQNEQQKHPDKLLIPKTILDATNFPCKKFGKLGKPLGSLSPTTLKHIRRMERKVELAYRCKLCNTRNRKLVAEAAYRSGVVILQCDGCSVNHLIIDNVGWFAKTNGKSFYDVLAEKSENVKVIKVDQHGALI